MISVLFLPAGSVTSASSRYRVYQYLKPLRANGFDVQLLSYPSPYTLGNKILFFFRAITIARRVDVIFIQKRIFPRLLPILQRLNPRIVYDFDDALFHPQKLTLNHHSNSYEAYHVNPYFHQSLQLSRHVIAGNDYLAEYARQFNQSVTVIPTVVDCGRYPMRPDFHVDHRVRLGWIGNSENLIYLQDLDPVLERLHMEFGDLIALHIVSDANTDLNSDILVRFQQWELEHEIEFLLTFDIGLMPIRDDRFTRGKCAFKAIQYMATGTPTVASDVGTNRQLIQHKINGLLAQTDAEWIEALKSLILDEKLREKLGIRGRERIESRFSIESALPTLKWVLEQTSKGND